VPGGGRTSLGPVGSATAQPPPLKYRKSADSKTRTASRDKRRDGDPDFTPEKIFEDHFNGRLSPRGS